MSPKEVWEDVVPEGGSALSQAACKAQGSLVPQLTCGAGSGLLEVNKRNSLLAEGDLHCQWS